MTRDYHNFTDIGTPQAKRRELNVGDIWINAARCMKCGDTIRSRNRHDFVTCGCGNLAVDGGSWYCKRSFFDNGVGFEECSVPFADVVDDD